MQPRTEPEKRAAIVYSFARKGPNGRVSRCRLASRRGLISGTGTGSGKPIFPTQRAALGAAAAMRQCGGFAQEAYLCLGNPTHWHLHRARSVS